MASDQKSPAESIRQIVCVLAHFHTLHPDRSDAQDILQEANVVLWQKIGPMLELTIAEP